MKLTFKKFRTPEYNGNICENLNDRENVYILSEFCDEGDIFGKTEKRGSLNQIVDKFLMVQILNSKAYLHR